MPSGCPSSWGEAQSHHHLISRSVSIRSNPTLGGPDPCSLTQVALLWAGGGTELSSDPPDQHSSVTPTWHQAQLKGRNQKTKLQAGHRSILKSGLLPKGTAEGSTCLCFTFQSFPQSFIYTVRNVMNSRIWGNDCFCRSRDPWAHKKLKEIQTS